MRRSLFVPLRKPVIRRRRSFREEGVPRAVHGGKHAIRAYHAHADLPYSTRKACVGGKEHRLTVIDLEN